MLITLHVFQIVVDYKVRPSFSHIQIWYCEVRFWNHESGYIKKKKKLCFITDLIQLYAVHKVKWQNLSQLKLIQVLHICIETLSGSITCISFCNICNLAFSAKRIEKNCSRATNRKYILNIKIPWIIKKKHALITIL